MTGTTLASVLFPTRGKACILHAHRNTEPADGIFDQDDHFFLLKLNAVCCFTHCVEVAITALDLCRHATPVHAHGMYQRITLGGLNSALRRKVSLASLAGPVVRLCLFIRVRTAFCLWPTLCCEETATGCCVNLPYIPLTKLIFRRLVIKLSC